MGIYKSLLLKAQDGDKDAIRVIAKDYEAKKQFKEAIRWYQQIGDQSSIKKLNKLLGASNNGPAESQPN